MRVSVVIPVGPGHESVVHEAIASVVAQTHQNTECVVINDCGQDLNIMEGTPLFTSNRRNAAYARNVGIQASTGEMFVCLDADDLLHEEFVEKTLQARLDGKWVYTDCYLEKKEGVAKRQAAKKWDVETLWRSGICYVTCLYPRAAWQAVGGFDETIGHEDWEFHLRLASAGYEGIHLKEPLVTYRQWLSKRSPLQPTGKSQSVIQSRYPLASLMHKDNGKEADEWPTLVYTGGSKRELIIAGRELSYKVSTENNMVSVHPNDVPYFMGTNVFRFAEKGELQAIDRGSPLRNFSLGSAL